MSKFIDTLARACEGLAHLADLIDLDWRACA
jgi:hypothetical protein